MSTRISFKKLTKLNGSKISLTDALTRLGMSRPDSPATNQTAVSKSLDQTIDASLKSSFDKEDDDVWRVCMDSKMSDTLRFYWSAVYLIGFLLPLVAVLVSFSGLFRFVRKREFTDGQHRFC